MIFRDKVFERLLITGLLVCLALYTEEGVYFLRHGLHSPDNEPWTRSLADCVPVANSSEIECPIEGYGMARYRFVAPREPKDNHIAMVDRH
jgi:hypothetical protein